MDDWFSYILLVILIALSAFFSASETAYTTVNKIRLQNYVDAGSKKAKTALFIAENYDRTPVSYTHLISRRGNSRADDIFSRSSRAGMAFYLEAVQPAVLCGKKINPDHLKR